MTIQDYQEAAHSTAMYPLHFTTGSMNYCVAGLCGEVGEVANVWKKELRGDNTKDEQIEMMSVTTRMKIVKELGDVLWYSAEICTVLGIKLEDVMIDNIAKLHARQQQGTIKGSGDNR